MNLTLPCASDLRCNIELSWCNTWVLLVWVCLFGSSLFNNCLNAMGRWCKFFYFISTFYFHERSTFFIKLFGFLMRMLLLILRVLMFIKPPQHVSFVHIIAKNLNGSIHYELINSTCCHFINSTQLTRWHTTRFSKWFEFWLSIICIGLGLIFFTCSFGKLMTIHRSS